MRRLVFTAALALLVVFPASAVASPGPTGKDRVNGARACKALKADSSFPFAATYPTFGKCVSAWAREQHQNRHNAAKACKAERAEDPAAFKEAYGTGPRKANAFGKCVSSKRKAETRADRRDHVNAAKACKAERADPAFAETHDDKTFAEFYGTNRNNRNAFGKCVSTKARAMDGSTP